MSAIGSYILNRSKQYNVYCTDLTISQLLDFANTTNKNLPKNAIIVSSPLNTDGEIVTDKGTPAILMTDSNSEVLPLTYTFDTTQFIYDNNTNTVKIDENYLLNFLHKKMK